MPGRSRSKQLFPRDVFSEQYLRFAASGSPLRIVYDPRNEFNTGQSLKAADIYHALDTPQGKRFLRQSLGLEVVRLSRYFDRAVVKVRDNKKFEAGRLLAPGIEALPSPRLQPQWAQSMVLNVGETLNLLNAGGAKIVRVRALDSSGVAVVGAKVAVIFDHAKKLGAEVLTDGDGRATLAVPSNATEVEAVLVVPKHSYWSFAEVPWKVPTSELTVTLPTFAEFGANPIRQFIQPGGDQDGKDVVVAVIDSGIGPHKDLEVERGSNHVPQEDAADHTDSGLGHGTHVAGIIAGKGKVNAQYRGLAPAVTLRSYRVFANGERDCDAGDVADAIDTAVAEGCHLINLSLGYPTQSKAISTALKRAAAKGIVAIAAAGNDGRQPLCFPASMSGVVGVSAIGHTGSYPANSYSIQAVALPRGTREEHFLAAFTNVGESLQAAAPGVGIISCAPGDFYAVQDGTSMAAPMVTGLAARLLSKNKALLLQEGSQQKADAVRSLILSAADRLGFMIQHVGHGLPPQ